MSFFDEAQKKPACSIIKPKQALQLELLNSLLARQNRLPEKLTKFFPSSTDQARREEVTTKIQKMIKSLQDYLSEENAEKKKQALLQFNETHKEVVILANTLQGCPNVGQQALGIFLFSLGASAFAVAFAPSVILTTISLNSLIFSGALLASFGLFFFGLGLCHTGLSATIIKTADAATAVLSP